MSLTLLRDVDNYTTKGYAPYTIHNMLNPHLNMYKNIKYVLVNHTIIVVENESIHGASVLRVMADSVNLLKNRI